MRDSIRGVEIGPIDTPKQAVRPDLHPKNHLKSKYHSSFEDSNDSRPVHITVAIGDYALSCQKKSVGAI